MSVAVSYFEIAIAVLPRCLGRLQKLAFLQERDDRFSTLLTSIGEEELSRYFLELHDACLVLFELVFVTAELFGAGYIFIAMVFECFQYRIQFCNDGIKFFIQLLVHPFIHSFENNIGLIGQKLLNGLGLISYKLLRDFGLIGYKLLRGFGLIGEPFIHFFSLVWAWKPG